MEKLPGTIAKEQEYALRVLNGEPIDEVLSGAETFRPGVEAYMAQYKAGTESQQEQAQEVPHQDSRKEAPEVLATHHALKGVENMKAFFETLGATHYLFTHQTNEETAQKLYETNFEVSPGTGISSTLTFFGADGALNQIERQLQGDAHRGYKGMVLIAVPKEVLDTQPMRSKAEALENMLLESPDYGKDGNPKLVIPHEYNAAYLQGDTLYTSYGN